MIELDYRLIQKDEFKELLVLYKSYIKGVFDIELSDYDAAALLIDLSKQPDFKAFGFYHGNELVGFLITYALNQEFFYVHSLYLKPHLRGHNNLKLILKEIENLLFETYKGYEADGTSIFGRGRLETLGAKVISIRYRKLKE